MSHIVTVHTKVFDSAAVALACQRLKLAAPARGTAQLFGGTVTGLLVELPDWKYPAVIDTTTGTVAFDNYEGRWGDQKELDRFLQMYAVEKAKLEAHAKGYPVTEQALENGSVKLEIIERA